MVVVLGRHGSDQAEVHAAGEAADHVGAATHLRVPIGTRPDGGPLTGSAVPRVLPRIRRRCR
jgi:hypothetical protein